MIIIALFCALAAIACSCMAEYRRNRAANLERLNCDLRLRLYIAEHQLACVGAALDDAQRNGKQWMERTDALLTENTTLLDDLMHTEREAQYLRGFVRRQKDVTAGVVLIFGTPNPKRVLTVASAEAMP